MENKRELQYSRRMRTGNQAEQVIRRRRAHMAGHTTIVTQPAERRFSPPDAFAPTSCAHASKLRQPRALDIARPAGETQHRNHADRRNVAGARTNAIEELSR